MNKTMSINDELIALQAGDLNYSPEKLAVCTAYCQRRLMSLTKSLESGTVPKPYMEQAKASIRKFSDFLVWAERQGVQIEETDGQGDVQ